MRKLTTKEFIQKANEVHSNVYNYSKTNYIHNKTKIIIICKIHGEFEQKPNNHLSGQGCPKCGGSKKLTTSEFIEKAIKVHGSKYDYSKVNYINNYTKITIVCPVHGEFEQTPGNHLNGCGCFDCGVKKIGNKKRMTVNEFIKKAKEVHGNRYNYDKVSYINIDTKISIKCFTHGLFEQTPYVHLKEHGCPDCANNLRAEKLRLNNKEFIQRAKEIHGNKYDYSKANYFNNQTKITIICSEHGEFEQAPGSHLSGSGCPRCALIERKVKNSLTTEEFVERARKVHGSKYNYLKVKYINAKRKVLILCSEHGEFEQVPNYHLSGNGCPKCKSSKGEEEVRKWLISNNVSFEEQKSFDGCVYKLPLKFDFYLPETNTIIEYDGEFHFMETGLKNSLDRSLTRDRIKDRYCIDNNINLIRIGFWEEISKILEENLLCQKKAK